MIPQSDSELESKLFPTPFHKLYQTACEDIPGSRQQKEQVCQKRLDKYFLPNKNKIDLRGGYFEKRIEADYSQPVTYPLPNAIMIYGVDFMSKK